MSRTEESGARNFFANPLVYIVLVGGVILWALFGFRPFGFPEGEYACTAKSGVQKYPISVFHLEGKPMVAIEYRPGEQKDRSDDGLTYSHSLFERHLNLDLARTGETYRCEHID